ncbi:MAG: hypothetical protein WBA12_02390 [Catalinimonas sp.]
MATESTAEKKCPNCGQWSPWQQHHDDRCVHCGAMLDPRAKEMHTFREEQEADNKERIKALLKSIAPDDPWYVRVGKRTYNVVQIVFAAVVSFIIWFATMIAG